MKHQLKKTVMAIILSGIGALLLAVAVIFCIVPAPAKLTCSVICAVSLACLVLASCFWVKQSATNNAAMIGLITLRLKQLRKKAEYGHILPKENDDFAKLITQLAKLQSHLKRYRRQVKMQQNTYLALTQSLNDGIVVINHKQQVLLANPLASQWFNIPSFDQRLALSQAIENLKLKTMLQSTLSTHQEQEKLLQVTFGSITKTLKVRTVFVPVSAHHFLAMAVMYDYDDILAQQRSHQQFVANVSHELKTPITAISGFAETLKQGAINDSQVAGQFVDIIAKQSAEMTALVNDLLALSRIDSHHELKLTKPKMNAVVSSVVAEFSARAAEKNITIKTKMAPNLAVVIDEAKVKYVLRNLLQNAVRYNRQNGQVKISVVAHKNDWTLAVSDTGMGIKKADISHIFDRFWRADASRARVTGGSGLGLAIVAEYVNAMSGRIKVLSQQNLGTQFRVTIPQFVMPASLGRPSADK